LKQFLIIFTESYPYGTSDLFLAGEIELLCAQHTQVILVPRFQEGALQPVPANCKVVVIHAEFKPERKIRHYILKWLFPILRSIIFTWRVTKNRSYYRKDLKKMVFDLLRYFEEGEIYVRQLAPYLEQAKVIYFFWFTQPFIQLALQKQVGRISQRLVSRGLGYDYDPVQTKLGLFPYRELELKNINSLVINSQWGASLVKKLYPRFAAKIDYSYLGLPDTNAVNPEPAESGFHLVSCSYVIDIKRVHLIVEILQHIDFPIRWTHLGKGPLLEEIRQLSSTLPKHVTVELPGFVPSVIDYYCTQPVDLFITTTWTEGLPYSLAEAIAHGIPVMGTAVCGIPEIITGRTGFLIPREFEPAAAARIISDYKARPLAEKQALRRDAKQFFHETFTAEKNMKEFINKFLN
jgi:colanic acid/amylovoran biosynthesis glycosyltransferase